MTIVEVSLDVLRTSDRAMSAREILEEIRRRNLYSFGAKEPLKVLSSTIRQEVTKGNPPRIRETTKGLYELSVGVTS